MKGRLIVVLSVFLILTGCASVQFKAPKEPIKVDVAMRLDVYQHVVKDINAIESIVSGGNIDSKPQSMLNFFCSSAYAQEGLSPGTEAAVMRRKARYADIASAKSRGLIAENTSGLLDITDQGRGDAALGNLVSAENNDRMEIYKAIAAKNGTSVSEVQKVYASQMR